VGDGRRLLPPLPLPLSLPFPPLFGLEPSFVVWSPRLMVAVGDAVLRMLRSPIASAMGVSRLPDGPAEV
jgi:hypothetical protein